MSDPPITADLATKLALMRDYEARACHFCQRRHPPFGFGPPLTRGETLWGCAARPDQLINKQKQEGEGRWSRVADARYGLL